MLDGDEENSSGRLALTGGGPLMAALIHYRCTAPAHQHPADPGAPNSPVTYHDGKWAYCPLGNHEGHSWAAIEPGSLDEIKQGLRSEARASESPA